MKALDMFKNLGYERRENEEIIEYYKSFINDSEIIIHRKIFLFKKVDKKMDIFSDDFVEANDIKAIYKQCKELKWI